MITMSVVELGPVSSAVVRMVNNPGKSAKSRPLFERRKARSKGAVVPNTPITTRPLNNNEVKERDDLMSLRSALCAED